MNYFVADFETTTNDDKTVTRVWAYAIYDIQTDEIINRGTTIGQFYNFVSTMGTCTIFFHNLKFDGSYIIHHLEGLGKTFVEGKKVTPDTYTAIIDNTKNWYGLDIAFPKIGKRGLPVKGQNRVTFLDSFKKISMTVERIAKAYDLPVSKGDCDHKKKRPIGYIPTDEEWDYVERDVIVVGKALAIQLEKGLSKRTSSADTLHKYKEKIGMDEFSFRFPVLHPLVDAHIRKGYKGGMVWNNTIHQYQPTTGINFDVGCGRVYDINSLYPYVMYTFLLPHGKPVYFYGKYEEDEKHPLYVQTFVAVAYLKKDHIPTVQTSGRFGKSAFLIETEEPQTFTMTNVDLDLFKAHYDVEILEYIGGYKFEGKTGMFNDYFDYWRNIKETTESPEERTIAKLMMNSLYGKFGTAVIRKNASPYIGDNGTLKFEEQEEEVTKGVYIPMACFITAYARKHLLSVAQPNYHRVAYIDTDSVHIVGVEPIEIDEHPTRFGAWKKELDFTSARYLHSKTYYEIGINEKGKHEHVIKCCGMPEKIKEEQVTWDNFLQGNTFTGKLRPVQIIGGVYLEETTFTMN